MQHQSDIVGDVRVVCDLRKSRTEARRRVLFLLGGGQAGIVSAERLRAFHDVGISADHFDLIVGISAGAYNALGFASQQTHILRDVYRAFCEFPYAGRMYTLIGEIEKRFDRATFERSRPEILIGISDSAGGLSLPSAKSEPNLFGLLYAASAIPPFSVGINPQGCFAYDGAFAHPCPVRQAIRKTARDWDREPIDVLVIANRPRPERLPWYDPLVYWWGVNVVLRMWAPGLCAGANSIDEKVGNMIPSFSKERRRFRTCAWFPNPSEYIGPMEWNPYTHQRVGTAIHEETEQVLNQCPR